MGDFAFRVNPSTNKNEVSNDGGVTWANFSGGELVAIAHDSSQSTGSGVKNLDYTYRPLTDEKLLVVLSATFDGNNGSNALTVTVNGANQNPLLSMDAPNYSLPKVRTYLVDAKANDTVYLKASSTVADSGSAQRTFLTYQIYKID